jgi:hypothetical protein
MIFLSHAWEDFEFTRWLALQLAQEGYGVWCDLTKLLGGENWPSEINDALQNRTQVFIFVLSKYSNSKENPLGELELALTIKKKYQFDDFVIPLKVDEIEKNELDFRIQNIQWLDFSEGWRDGLEKLLKLLDRNKISKNSSFDAKAVNTWWINSGSDSITVIPQQETLQSNRFEVISLPKYINVFVFESEPVIEGHLQYSIIPYNNYLISFNTYDEINTANNIVSQIVESVELETTSLLDGTCPIFANKIDATNQFTRLLNQSFEKYLTNLGLRYFRLANGTCYYFNKEILEKGTIQFKNNGELNSRVKLWGKHLSDKWHFAISSRLYREPQLHYLITPHVIMHGNNGMRAASVSVTKNWRNDKWRVGLRASMLHIANDKELINIVNTKYGSLSIQTKSLEFISPVFYNEPIEPDSSDE